MWDVAFHFLGKSKEVSLLKCAHPLLFQKELKKKEKREEKERKNKDQIVKENIKLFVVLVLELNSI